MSKRLFDFSDEILSLEAERDTPTGVTIDEIERRILELLPGASLSVRRSFSMLFAILKQGSSVQKLQWFTEYDMDFIRQSVEALRSGGFLYTGTLSTQYVLGQVPGSEDLIERITGQKVITNTNSHRAPTGYQRERQLKAPPAPPVDHSDISHRKEEPMNTATVVNGAAEPESDQPQETCLKTPGCPRPAGHNGICRGQKMKRRRAPAAKAKPASAPGAKTAKAAPANSHKPQPVSALTATAAQKKTSYFKIEFEDETETINVEGHGRDVFTRKLKALYQEFAGGSND